LELDSGESKSLIGSDARWRVARKEPEGWHEVGFDDATWAKAKVVAKYGEGPWGNLEQNNASFAPYAMGVKDELRIAYAISSRPLVLTQLQPRARYDLTEFDPVDNVSRKETVQTDATGALRRPAPPHGHDWALVLQLKR
jgi:hypothetical protein